MHRSHRQIDPSHPKEMESDLTPWLEQARRELELLRKAREQDPWEGNLLNILGDILSTAEDAIGSFRVNNWERLFAFLERIQDKAHQGIEQLNPRM
jgi:hypothetical protein